MVILLLILLVGAGVLIAALNNASSSTFGDGMVIAIVVVVAGLSAILIKLMIDDYQAERLRDGKPRLKFSRKRARPYLRVGVMLLGTVLIVVLAAYQTKRHWLMPEPIVTVAEAPAPATAPSEAPLAPQGLPFGNAPQLANTPSPASFDPVQAQGDIQRTLDAWRKAWSSRQIGDYLEHYSARFAPADGLSHAAWQRQRRERLGKARDLSIDIADIQFLKLTGERAEISFRQAYKAHNFAETSRKSLSLELENGAWRIVRETSGPL
jgi:hypothetical protein